MEKKGSRSGGAGQTEEAGRLGAGWHWGWGWAYTTKPGMQVDLGHRGTQVQIGKPVHDTNLRETENLAKVLQTEQSDKD